MCAIKRTAVSKDSAAGSLGSIPWSCRASPTACFSCPSFLQVMEPKRTRPVSPLKLGSSGDPGREDISRFSAREPKGICLKRGEGRLPPTSGEQGPRGDCSDPVLVPPHCNGISGDPAPSGSLRRRGDAVAACQDMSFAYLKNATVIPTRVVAKMKKPKARKKNRQTRKRTDTRILGCKGAEGEVGVVVGFPSQTQVGGDQYPLRAHHA